MWTFSCTLGTGKQRFTFLFKLFCDGNHVLSLVLSLQKLIFVLQVLQSLLSRLDMRIALLPSFFVRVESLTIKLGRR